MKGSVKKYEVGDNFFLVSVSGYSRGVDSMWEQARRQMQRIRNRSENQSESRKKEGS